MKHASSPITLTIHSLSPLSIGGGVSGTFEAVFEILHNGHLLAPIPDPHLTPRGRVQY